MASARPPGRIVLALQGGGALGAYQAGVYQALHESGFEPDWVVGTSIGAINGAIIAGNELEHRLERLASFWDSIRSPDLSCMGTTTEVEDLWSYVATLMQGVTGLFVPNPSAWWSLQLPLGAERAAFYTTTPLRQTLGSLIDPERLNRRAPRLTVGAVNARTGEMRYFDSGRNPLHAEHVLASAALPPGFPAIRVDGEPYWDGGLYSNTPIEVVLDDTPRRSSTIFSVHLWSPSGSEPDSILQVLERQKEIQYSSRVASHVARQQQIHRLRHVISELATRIPEPERNSVEVQELVACGCRTTMHIVQLLASQSMNESYARDVNFTSKGIRSRWESGYADARKAIAEKPWNPEGDPLEGIFVHEYGSGGAVSKVETQ